MKRRKPWLAGLMSFLCPGLGQLYNGQILPAVVAFVLGLSLAVYSTLFFFDSLPGLVQTILLGFVLDIIFAVQATKAARKIGEVPLKPWQRWWVYATYAVVIYGLPDGYGTIIPTRAQSFQIPSESMLPTLLVGDRLVADGWAYWRGEPKRGDIVVFNYPKEPSTKYVKRLIGLPGDTVEVRQGEVYVNGKMIEQLRTGTADQVEGDGLFTEYEETIDGVRHLIYRAQTMRVSNFGPVKVPTDEYFMLGDNRDRSNDSRFWGFVKRNELVARMNFIFFSWDAKTGKPRWERFGLRVE